jgi:putative endonuclease
MQYHVYILTNQWRTVLYVGVTRDIEGRVFNHKTKATKGFSNKYNCDRLIHLETYGHVKEALAREKGIEKISQSLEGEFDQRKQSELGRLKRRLV